MPTPIFQPYSPNRNDDINKQIKGLTNAYYDSTQYLQWILSHLNSSNITSLTTDKLIAGKALIGTALIEELTVGGNVAQGTAARTFVNTPAPPYKVGDLWVEGATGDIKKCNTDRTTGDYSADDWEIAAKYTDDSGLTSFVSGIYASDIESLQSQIDGRVISWFYAYEPTLLNEPALSWNTPELKNNHLGDLFYDTTTGYGYRFSLIESVYQWVRIIDTDVVLALANAQQAQDTADGKRRVFVATPTVPYDVGDLWSGGAAGDLKRCKTAKTSAQSYSADDWELASKYTDDTVANTAIGRLNDISSDSKITPIEKLQAKQEWDIIVKEGNATTGSIIATADAFEVSHDDYSAKYSALEAYLTPINLLTANQSNIETNTSGFTRNDSNITRDTSEHWEGLASLYIQNGTFGSLPATLNPITVLPNTHYTFSCYTKGMVDVVYVNEYNNYLYVKESHTGYSASETWQRITISFVTSATTNNIEIVPLNSPNTAARFDGLMLNYGDTAPDWVIGKQGIFYDMTATDTIDRAEWDTVWEDYFDERTKLMNAISAKAKAIADGSVQLDTLYNKVKISTTDGIQVLDSSDGERVKIGDLGSGKYGLVLKDSVGNVGLETDSNGNVILRNRVELPTAGMTNDGEFATSVRMWAGDTYANREIAPFRVLQDGTVHATKFSITPSQIDTAVNKIGTMQIEDLIVGSNVTMGADATISWSKVTNQPTIPTTSEITQIAADYIATPNLITNIAQVNQTLRIGNAESLDAKGIVFYDQGFNTSMISGGSDIAIATSFGRVALTSYGGEINITSSDIHGTEWGSKINLVGYTNFNNVPKVSGVYVSLVGHNHDSSYVQGGGFSISTTDSYLIVYYNGVEKGRILWD